MHVLFKNFMDAFIMDVAMGQITRSTERMSSFTIRFCLQNNAVSCLLSVSVLLVRHLPELVARSVKLLLFLLLDRLLLQPQITTNYY